MSNVSLIGIPFYTLAKYHGMGTAVATLRSAGIDGTMRRSADAFNDMGDCDLGAIRVDSGPHNLRNFPQFLQDTDTVYRKANLVDSEDFAFCLGGECAFTVGALAGFKDSFKGKPGMLWIDAHGDFNTPETTSSGFIGGMPLAFTCGRGPKLSTLVENVKPILQEENVVHLASRALDPPELKAMQDSPMRVYSAKETHKQGIASVARETADYLGDRCDWITCHLDVDCIDPTIIPAVNFPEPGGLTLEEVKMAVEALKNTDKLKVFDLAAYNSMMDQDRVSAQRLVNLMAEVFPPLR